jgi:hypothetical protein
MAEILAFPQQRCKPQLARELARGAKILFFTGVRYCRELAPAKRRKLARRKTAQILEATTIGRE